MIARARQVASKNLHTFAFGKAKPIYAFGSGSIFSPHLQAPPSHSSVVFQLIPLRSIPGYLCLPPRLGEQDTDSNCCFKDTKT